jgi:hypothetical protein
LTVRAGRALSWSAVAQETPLREEAMKEGMKYNSLLVRVACVALIVCVVFPVGRMLYPHVAGAIDTIPFSAIEAVVTTTLGFSLYGALFG